MQENNKGGVSMFIFLFPILSILIQISFIGFIISLAINNRNKKTTNYDSYAVFAKKFAYFFIGFTLISTLSSVLFGTLPFRLVEVLLYCLLTAGGIAITAQFYKSLSDRLPSIISNIFFFITVVSLIGATIGFINGSGSFDFFNWVTHIISSSGIIFGLALVAYIMSSLISNDKMKYFKRNTKVKPSIIQHYNEKGLSNDEIKYFREQMSQLRDQIHSLDKELNTTAKLRAIDIRHNTINISKQFFQDLVKEPRRLSDAGNFIYRILPSLNDLSMKYNEVNKHIAKSKQSYVILEKSAQTIDELASRLTEEYVNFHENTFNDLEDEVNLAQRNLNKQSDWDSLHSLDDILNDFKLHDDNNN